MGHRKGEKKLRTTPAELALLLEEAARGLRERGVFSAAGVELVPGKELELEIEWKEKEGKVELELEVRWQAGEAVSAGKEPGSLRELKREMEKVLDLIRDDPTPEAVERFGELVRAFSSRARPEWQEGIRELEAAGRRLAASWSRGDGAAVRAAVEELGRVKRECHRRFR